jgi:hypothetical protein
MPLRADISAEILAWLSPASLRKLNATWRGRGLWPSRRGHRGHCGTLDQDTFDYEALLGHLEAQYLNDAREGLPKGYHGSTPGWRRWCLRSSTAGKSSAGIPTARACNTLKASRRLARNNRPLWIFSLQPRRARRVHRRALRHRGECGFSPRTVFLPCRSADGQPVAALRPSADRRRAGERPASFLQAGWTASTCSKSTARSMSLPTVTAAISPIEARGANLRRHHRRAPDRQRRPCSIPIWCPAWCPIPWPWPTRFRTSTATASPRCSGARCWPARRA